MWCSSRIPTLVFNRPNFLLLPTLRLHLVNAVASSQVSRSLNEESVHFLSWLQQKAGIEISTALSIGNSIYGRSLFASRFIQAEECILQVPHDVHLMSDKILPKISSFASDDIGRMAQLAVTILAEQKLGKIFWTKDELEMVRQSLVYQETINHKDHLEKEYLKVKPALDHFLQIFGEVRIDSFLHAYATVASRAWKSTEGPYLIPFADFLNHNGTSTTLLLNYENEKISKVIADRDYAPGEEVLLSYGKFPNSTLILDFGFTVPCNIYDQVRVWMSVPDNDPLHSLKLELLHKHFMTTITHGNGFNSGNLFTIKEVRSPKGKGKGIPQALRAFARVLSTTTAEELSDFAMEAEKNDGRLARLPLKDGDHEIVAHHMLLSKITDLIQEHDISIKDITGRSNHSVSSMTNSRSRSEGTFGPEISIVA